MPEGPEVKRISEQLSKAIAGKTLVGVEIFSGRYLKKYPENIDAFSNTFPLKIVDVACKGKFIYISTSNDWYIWNTLGMTGSWTPNQNEEHIRLSLEFIEDDLTVYFKDIRNFGTLKFERGEDKLKEKLSSLGPDILMEDISIQDFQLMIKKNSKKTLPEFLMNQKNISGVGNYIKAESLYLAKLSPHRLCGSLSNTEATELLRAITSVIRESYKSGGSTFKTYADFNGNVGTFSDRFMIYRQQNDPNGYPVMTTETLDKRTTWWVPQIQK